MKKTILILALSMAVLPSFSAPKDSNVLNLKSSITDDSIIFPESFETDTRKLLESWYMKNYTDTDDRYRTSSNPPTTDETIRRRLAELPTLIDMPFNQIVRSYIDRYVEQGRPLVASVLGLATYYMPIFEQALEAEQIPMELKYLPVIESALNPNAVSRSGAAGLWQFMPAAARGYDLEISSLVDERRDPYKSSRRAARMLHDLYDMYGDWTLAIAAYNCGPGAVNKAIRRAGGDPKSHDFWSIYEYLSPQTRGYVPMFIAANYVMNFYKEHNISPVLPTRPLVTDTIGISRRVHFDQISNVLNIPKEEIRILNPQFRADIIPATVTHQYMLILPAQQVQAYIMSENEILAYEADKYARRVDANPGDSAGDESIEVDEILDETEPLLAARSKRDESDDEQLTVSHESDAPDSASSIPSNQNQPNLSTRTRLITHTVASGETINEIAEKYQVRVSDLRSWNSLRRNAVRPGQKLRIETSVAVANTVKTAPSQAKANESAPSSSKSSNVAASSQPVAKSQNKSSAAVRAAKPLVHEIKSGESLTTIARKHGVTIEELRKANNLTGDNIRAGETLKIPSRKGVSTSVGKSSKSKSGSSTSRKKSSKKSGSKKKRR